MKEYGEILQGARASLLGREGVLKVSNTQTLQPLTRAAQYLGRHLPVDRMTPTKMDVSPSSSRHLVELQAASQRKHLVHCACANSGSECSKASQLVPLVALILHFCFAPKLNEWGSWTEQEQSHFHAEPEGDVFQSASASSAITTPKRGDVQWRFRTLRGK